MTIPGPRELSLESPAGMKYIHVLCERHRQCGAYLDGGSPLDYLHLGQMVVDGGHSAMDTAVDAHGDGLAAWPRVM